MSRKESNPPELALWLLWHARPGGDNEALSGDLIERFREGQTGGWFWRQVLVAIAIHLLGEIRRHWPQIWYAIAGTEMPRFLWNAVDKSGRLPFSWYLLPWPLSQVVFELRVPVIVALAALPVLAAALVINGTFRWLSVLRTGMITLALIALGHFMPDAFPWLLRPVEGSNHQFKEFIIPRVVLVVLFFSTFLVSAWLGCRSPRRADEQNRQAE